MSTGEALRKVAEVCEGQWGIVTTGQARRLGVSYMSLTRLVQGGMLIRLARGVYKAAGAPRNENEDLIVAWLMAEPDRFAYERVMERPASVVVSGESAAHLHEIGDFPAARHEFTTPTRRQTQRSNVRYRVRDLPEQDVTIRAGLPVTTRERTIADLIETRQDLSLIADALADAARHAQIDVNRLIHLLAPLAERNGHHKGDGVEFLKTLMKIAGMEIKPLTRR